MTKVNIISGFLGAGKTTFIKRLIKDVFKGEKLVLIENEFGEIGVDGGFLQDAGIQITEMNSGCICCSLVGDFTKALQETADRFKPDRIIIEPSGVGKLSDVIAAVKNVGESVKTDTCITVVDATKCKMYRKNFGEFYENQILYSDCVLLTRTDKASEEKIELAISIIRDINKDANIITTHLDELSCEQITAAFKKDNMEKELLIETVNHEHEHHHEHHEHDEHCDCGCHEHHHEHHEHDEHCDCGCHEHHHEHHEHDEHCDCGCHEHHHEHHKHDEHCDCGCHEHHGHHHHADDTFESWGFETAKKYSESEIQNILSELDSGDFGVILRAKGMLASDNEWLYFDYVPEEHNVRTGTPCFTGKICVIGAELNKEKLENLFLKSNN